MLLASLLAASVTAALAQGASAPAAPPAPASSPAKKELVAKVLQIQQGSIEGMAVALAQQSIAALVQQAGEYLQTRVAPDKREALAKDVQADIKKYGDEVVPLLKERAVKLAPSTIGAMLEEKFTEDELRQLVAILESPVQKKYAQINGELGQSLVQKLVADTRATVEPKMKALDASLSKRLGAAAGASSPDAKPAPAKKK
jgi:hypothetical protein